MSQGDSKNLCFHPLLSSYPGERRCLVIVIKVLTSCGVLRLSAWRLIPFPSFSFPFRFLFPLSSAHTISGGGGAAAAAQRHVSV